MTVTQRFSDFLTNLKLTLGQQTDGETKFKGVTKCLNKHFYGSDSESEHGMLVGSWGKKTRIRPPRDVDAMFVLPILGAAETGTNCSRLRIGINC